MVCLCSELALDPKTFEDNQEEDEEEEDDLYEIAHNPHKLYKVLHSKDFLIQDAYALFSRIMDLGIKELYYEETLENI